MADDDLGKTLGATLLGAGTGLVASGMNPIGAVVGAVGGAAGQSAKNKAESEAAQKESAMIRSGSNSDMDKRRRLAMLLSASQGGNFNYVMSRYILGQNTPIRKA